MLAFPLSRTSGADTPPQARAHGILVAAVVWPARVPGAGRALEASPLRFPSCLADATPGGNPVPRPWLRGAKLLVWGGERRFRYARSLAPRAAERPRVRGAFITGHWQYELSGRAVPWGVARGPE